MPRPSVVVSHKDYVAQADRLRELAAHMPALAANYQSLLSEMIALQAFYFFERAIESIAAKLVCGANYADGVVPVIAHAATTIDDALTHIVWSGRALQEGFVDLADVRSCINVSGL